MPCVPRISRRSFFVMICSLIMLQMVILNPLSVIVWPHLSLLTIDHPHMQYPYPLYPVLASALTHAVSVTSSSISRAVKRMSKTACQHAGLMTSSCPVPRCGMNPAVRSSAVNSSAVVCPNVPCFACPACVFASECTLTSLAPDFDCVW